MKQLDLKTLALLAYAAVSIPTAAILQQYHFISIPAAEEDNCEQYFGAYELSAVVPVKEPDGSHHVICQYR